jgi:hypothetical protein
MRIGERSRRAGLKAQAGDQRIGGPEGQWKAQAGNWQEGGARNSRRRKSQAGSKAELEGWRKARAGSWLEGTAGRSTVGASHKVGTKAKPKDAAADESRRLGSKAGLEGRLKAQAGDRQESGAGR